MTVEYTLLALAVPALLAAAGFAVWTRLRTRRMLDTLGKMLDDAIRGEFRESLYDESRLSALETRMATISPHPPYRPKIWRRRRTPSRP